MEREMPMSEASPGSNANANRTDSVLKSGHMTLKNLEADEYENTGARGPRLGPDGKVLARSILGDPMEFETLVRDPSRRGSEGGSPVTTSNVGRARFASNASFASAPSFEMNLPLGQTSRSVTAGGHEELLDSQREAMDKEAELRRALSLLSDTKRREKEDRVKKLKGMHIFQRHDELRERRILARHEKRQAEWESFRERMAKRLNKDPEDLVINRAEEFRKLLEEKALIAKATPIEKRQGGNVWQMSLRDAWTRYIAVGGQFSGLEMPFIDRPELQPESMEYIRQPFMQHKDPKVRASVRGLDRTQQLKEEYHKAITVLQPQAVEFDGLHVDGAGLEHQYQHKLNETVRVKEEEEEERRKEEAERARRASRMPTYRSKGASTDGGETARSATAMSMSRAPSTRMLDTKEAVGKGIAFTKWEPEVEGPSMNFETDRLVLEANKGELGEGLLNCMNIGNTAVYYKWVKTEKQAVPGANNEQQRFFLRDLVGTILPGETKQFAFTFKSDKPGVFSEVWTMESRPDVPETQHVITIKGISKEEDVTKAERARLEHRLSQAQMQHAVEEAIEEVVAHVGTPRAKSKLLVEDPDLDRQVFIAQNKEAQIYYSNTTLKLFRSLADSTFELLSFPAELRKWDSSLESLKRLIYAIEDDGERERHIIQFNEIMKVAGTPPTSSSMFNSICYELVAELADTIPDVAHGIRKKLDLPDKVLVFKENAERELIYSTDPSEMQLWRYDSHLMRIGGPPVPYADQEENEGTVKMVKTIPIEVWGPEEKEEDEEGEEAKEEGEEGAAGGDERDSEELGRLEFEYLLRLNDGVYHAMAQLSERMALLNAEADLRSQVIAQVVMELNAAAADEIRTLIREDKMDEARKIDGNKYQRIVDLDAIFRDVMKEEQEAEKKRQDAHMQSEERTGDGTLGSGHESADQQSSGILSVPSAPGAER